MSENKREGRTPPKSDEAEQSLLGALLLDPERAGEVLEIVQHEDFYQKRHQLIFEVISGLSERSAPIDFVTVGEALKALGSYEEVGGAQYLVELSSSVTSSAHAAYHAHLVAEVMVVLVSI